MKRLSFFLCFLLAGCNGGCGGCTDIKKQVGLGPSEPPPAESKSEDPEAIKLRIAEAKQRELDEKARLAEEKRLKEQQLKDGDALVAKWADQLQNNAQGSGFPRQEGLIELDPWGNPLRIDYRQEWFDEIAVIRSAGPDGKMDTVDDLTRTRKASNPGGILQGMGWQAWLVVIWITTGLLAFLFSAGIANHRKSTGKSHKHRHPLAFALAVILLAPLLFLIFGIQFIGSALGATGDFFDGFDFDFFD